jgi:hypothetical protein
MHEAEGVHAMVQIIQVAKLMEGHLGGPFHLKVQGLLGRRGGRLETVNGNKRDPAPLPRFSEHMGKDGDEEVQVDNPDDPIALREGQGFQSSDYRARVVLVPPFVVRMQGMFHGRKNEGVEMEIPENVGGDGPDGQFTNLSKGNHTDGLMT